MDEVEIRGKRLRLDQLRQEMVRLEERIYARYNEVNTIDKYDVICSDYTRTGTRLAGRYCRPMFVEEAKAEEAQVAFQARQRISESQKSAGSIHLPDSPVPKVQAQMPGYRSHFRKVTERDAQIESMLRERAAVADQLQRTEREVFGK